MTQELYYEDLLNVPFKINGRNKDGMDCYGLVLECCRRTGQPLNDIVYDWENKTVDKLKNYAPLTNTVKINGPEKNCILQSNYSKELHVGFMINKDLVLHMTHGGVRLTPLFVFDCPQFFRVGTNQNDSKTLQGL